MKINPIGISSYQQLTGQEARRKSVAAENDQTGQSKATVAIPPQSETQSSRLAVKVEGGSYAEFLSPEEKGALDLLFNRFSDRSRFGQRYNHRTAADDDNGQLGKVIDLKV